MEIVIVGSAAQLKEAQSKFGNGHRYSLATDHHQAESSLKGAHVVFDFLISDNRLAVKLYQSVHSLVVFLDTTLITLSSLEIKASESTLVGFCGMPTFLNRELLEVSLLSKDQEQQLKEICAGLNTSYRVVADKVGFITPRVVCMIINEAYYTVEEETASKEDIDKAMKLGTNYPYGPFEWSERIGKKNVCSLLEAVHRDTNDSRYKICDALKKESRKM